MSEAGRYGFVMDRTTSDTEIDAKLQELVKVAATWGHQLDLDDIYSEPDESGRVWVSVGRR